MLTATIERAQRGDSQAMREVLADLAPSIRRFAMGMCRRADEADDVLQDALLAVAMHLPEYQARASLSSWAFAIARSACSHRRRGRKNETQPSLEDAAEPIDDAPTPEALAERGELSALVGRAVNALPDDQREALLLRDVEGLSATEAASVLEVTVEALKSRLHRARRGLYESLRPVVAGDARDGARGGSECPDIVLAWSRNLEGDLRRDDCADLEKHLERCTHCSAVCDALKREVAACSRSRTDTVSSDVRARVERAVGAWRDEFEKLATHDRSAR